MKLDNQDYLIIRRILRKLNNLSVWGGKHTSIVRVYRSVPSHLIGQAKDLVKLLIKKQVLVPKITTEDMHVRLNEEKKKEIELICSTENLDEIRKVLED